MLPPLCSGLLPFLHLYVTIPETDRPPPMQEAYVSLPPTFSKSFAFVFFHRTSSLPLHSLSSWHHPSLCTIHPLRSPVFPLFFCSQSSYLPHPSLFNYLMFLCKHLKEKNMPRHSLGKKKGGRVAREWKRGKRTSKVERQHYFEKNPECLLGRRTKTRTCGPSFLGCALCSQRQIKGGKSLSVEPWPSGTGKFGKSFPVCSQKYFRSWTFKGWKWYAGITKASPA